jgi:hypothetical protein
MNRTARYHLSIQTAPHQPWHPPMGWTADDLTGARSMARTAAAQWMRVRLIDSQTGARVRFGAR